MVSVSEPEDFNHLKFGLCLQPKSLNEHTCTSSLKIPQIGAWGDTDLEKIPGVRLTYTGPFLQLKHACDTQKMEHGWIRKILEKEPKLLISWLLDSPLQPFSLKPPHLRMSAPSTSSCTEFGICPKEKGEGGETRRAKP